MTFPLDFKVAQDEQLVAFGDVHLGPETPMRSRWLERFLLDVGRSVRHLVCVGDLFDYWLGPEHASRVDAHRTLEVFRTLVKAGVHCHLIHGNRDFHIWREMTCRGVKVYPNGCWVQLPNGRNLYFCHGDQLCRADIRYQRMRRAIRSWALRQAFRALPLELRECVALAMRGKSQREITVKTHQTMSVDPAAVAAWHRRGADMIVCGHVHRQRLASITTARGQGWLWTLGPWEERIGGSYLSWCRGHLAFNSYPPIMDSSGESANEWRSLTHSLAWPSS
jgi:UDP-2,3-diacylglucosamine hydrolase